MKKFAKTLLLIISGSILVCISAVLLIMTLAYYRQPEAYGWSIGMAVATSLSVVCFATASDVYNAK